MTAKTPFWSIARAVAQGAPASDLLQELHEEVLRATGGSQSVMVRRARSAGEYTASSGAGDGRIDGLRLRGAEANLLEAWTDEKPALRPLNDQPALQKSLAASTALVVPLAGPGTRAFLIVGDPRVAAEEAVVMGERAQAAFTLALELLRAGHDAAVHRRIQELLLEFSRGISERLTVSAALESLTAETNALFGARRTSVWLHDRRPRELWLAASSDPAGDQAGERVAADSDVPAARGLRADGPQFYSAEGDRVLVAPLRGWRRALGTVVIEGEARDLDDQQALAAASGLARELSVAIENVQLLESVLQQRRLLENTFNSLLDLVVVADNDSRVVQTNEAFAGRAGVARGAVLGRSISDLIGPEMADWAAAQTAAHQAPAEGPADLSATAHTRQFTDPRLDGIFSTTVTPLLNQDGQPVGRVLVARDITAQTRLELEREALRERLAQSAKLASLGQFVAGIAHEMNNPLQGVLGHLELLIETSEDARPVRPTLRRIYQEGDRAAKIVRNLLVFTGSQRMSRTNLRIEQVLGRALASRAAARRRNQVDISRRVADGLPGVSGDALLLQQALLNILINAEHAIAETGMPGRIDTSIEHESAKQSVVLRIRDTGPGIPDDVLPRIFDPFFTTKDVGKGIGLGLAITYGIVHDHGGTIYAANAEEGGARFTIELPAIAP